MKLEEEINQKKFRNDSHKLGVNLVYTFNWLNSYQASVLKPYGITYQQFNVLRILRGNQPHSASVKLIRERMLDKMSDASRIVEKLRVKGYVERTVCSSDRRACDVNITEKGLTLLSKIDNDSEAFDKIFVALSPSEINDLNLLLDKLRG